MKKTSLLLTGIVLAIWVAMSLWGYKDNYSAERELWGINRQLKDVAAHLESEPSMTMDRLADRYRKFIQEYKGTVHAQEGRIMLGNLYALRKDYAQARNEYTRAVGSDADISSRALLAMARSYEIEGNWNKALEVYTTIIKHYPLTDAGFYVPMYLAKAGAQGERTHATRAYTDALAFYRDIASAHPNTALEYNALRMMAICQLIRHDYPSCIKTMGELILKYPKAQALKEGVNVINVLSVTKTHDYDAGIHIYQDFLQKYPNHPVNHALKKMIRDLQFLKSRGLTVQTKPLDTGLLHRP